MFWKFNLLTSSHVDTLLEKEDVTLRELMDEDDILQECKAQNRKLIDFLTQPENMEDMVKMITKEPDEEVEEKIRFKYPNTACELLTSDVSQINEKLASDRELVDQLYSFLQADRPLNPLLASFFSKVMGLLITRKSEMIFEYLKSQKDFVGSLLHHIGTSAIMDLLLRLITCIESPETRLAVIEWLNENQIVQRLVDCMVSCNDEDVHCNAAQSLCDIVRLGREQMVQLQDADPDPLLTTVEQEETVSKLLKNMFDGEQNESVIVNGLFVIHTLLEVRRQGTESVNDPSSTVDTDRVSQGISHVMAAIVPRLKDFHNLLLNPPKQRFNAMPTSVGVLDPPLGNVRLQVAKLITALVATNMATVNLELASLNTLQALVDLYFQYCWNNFLHTQVEQCIVLVLNNPTVEVDGTAEQPLLHQLFTDVRLPQRLLDEWEQNDRQQSTEGGKRKGFMGHLTKMTNAVSASAEKLPEECKQRWDAFVLGTLAEVNKKNTVEFRGHPLASSSEDDDADFKDIPFPQDTAMQQAFSDYQLQQMTSNFIDQFGFNEEEFAEQEEKIDAPFSERISSINFNIQANEVTPSNTMFEQACNDRIQQFDDDDSDEDIWVEKPVVFDKNAQHMRSGRLQGQTAQVTSSDDSTDSEEELDSPTSISQSAPTTSPTGTSPPTSAITSAPLSLPKVTVPAVLAAAEKMDIDFVEDEVVLSGAWPSSAAEGGSSAAEPTDMETSSPWDIETAPPAAPREGWATFEKAEATSGESDSWADFSSFSDMAGSSGIGPRSSSPVAMDTSEGSRGNIYMVGEEGVNKGTGRVGGGDALVFGVAVEKNNQPADSADLKLESVENSELPDSTSTSSVDAVTATTSTAASADSEVTSSDLVSSTSVDPDLSEPAKESCMDLKESQSSEANSKEPATSTSVTLDSTATSSTTSSTLRVEVNSSDQDCDDDLSANFAFLTGSGLIRKGSQVQKATDGHEGESSAADTGVEEADTTISIDLEATRKQAKEAMELYSTETTVRNGPV